MADQMQEFQALTAQPQFQQLTQQLRQQAQQIAKMPRGADVCAYWKIAKPFVELAVAILKKLPFGWATDIATGLQALDDAMTHFCPA